jgi:hypothetical protein
MSLTASHDPGDVFPAGTTQVTYTATDDLGNTAICSFLVQVMDAQPPAWSGCPGNVSVTAPPGACSAEVNWTSPTASDNCGIDSQSSSHSPGGAFPVGVTPVSYIATDTAGNMSTCSFDVTILDEEDPVIASCPGNMSVFTSPGNPGAAVTWMQPTASDNCAGVALSASHVPGASFPVGTTSVSFTATDAGGRMASCGFSVTVVDGEAPTLTGCPMNIAVAADAGQCTASVGWTEPTAADNVGLTGMTSTHSPGASFPIGTTNVTYVATDVHGNAAQCVFSITVTDHEGPAFVACEPTRTAQADSMCRSVVPDLAGSAVVTDNCDSTAGVHQSPAAGTVVGLGSTPVTLTATDANGNTRTCVVMFAVVPNGCDTPDEPGPTPGPGPAPTDVDGVDSSIEDAAPNSGDGNGDGVPDSAQDHVSSLIDARGLYVTLAAPAGTQLAGVFVGGNPSPDTSPDGAEFPVGFLNFSVLGVTPGGMVDVQVILHGPTDQPLDVYWKHGPTPGQASPHWYLFDHDGETGAIIRGDVITLKLRDGGRGDSDLQADGVIVDPGAPAIGGPESGPAPPGEPANDLCDNPLISALLPVRICGLGCSGALLGTIAGMAAMRRTGRRRSLR